MTRIAHVFTSSKFVPFVRPILVRLASLGYEPHVITSPGVELEGLAELGVRVHSVSMSRKIAPFSDAISLLKLRRCLTRIDPAVLHCHTPKGGLLGVLAGASLSRAPRIYQMHGSPWISARGLKRALFWLTEATSSRLAHETIAVSPSLSAVGEKAGFLARGKTTVLGGGSAYGVDVERFPVSGRDDSSFGIRARLGLGSEVKVLGFAGRYIQEKGLQELREVIESVRVHFPSARLLLAGSTDGEVPRSLGELLAAPGVVDLGFQSDMTAFYRALDVFLLPSHREGLSTVLLEAMATGVAVIGSETIGIIDVIEHGRTGLLAPPLAGTEWARRALELLSDDPLRKRLAEAGARHVRKSFPTEAILTDLVALYTKLGVPPPRSR